MSGSLSLANLGSGTVSLSGPGKNVSVQVASSNESWSMHGPEGGNWTTVFTSSGNGTAPVATGWVREGQYGGRVDSWFHSREKSCYATVWMSKDRTIKTLLAELLENYNLDACLMNSSILQTSLLFIV